MRSRIAGDSCAPRRIAFLTRTLAVSQSMTFWRCSLLPFSPISLPLLFSFWMDLAVMPGIQHGEGKGKCQQPHAAATAAGCRFGTICVHV